MMVRRVFSRSVTALAAILLVVLLFSMGTRAQDRNPPARQFPDIQLPSPARGAAALSALAPYLPQLAASYGKSEDELRNIFLRDHTLWTDTRGRLFYGCEFGPPPVNAPGAENAGAVLEAPFPDDQTFLLHSRPSATKVIYLDTSISTARQHREPLGAAAGPSSRRPLISTGSRQASTRRSANGSNTYGSGLRRITLPSTSTSRQRIPAKTAFEGPLPAMSITACAWLSVQRTGMAAVEASLM